jgi:O-antigen/teichoic acid export membrane protein
MGTERFGVLSVALGLLAYFTIFDLGIGRALTRFLAANLSTRSEEEAPTLFWSALGMLIGLGVIGALAITALCPLLVTRVFEIPPALRHETRVTFYLLAWALPFVIGNAAMWGVLSAHQRFDLGNAINIPIGCVNYFGPLIAVHLSQSLIPVAALLVACRLCTWAAYLAICLRIVPELRRRIAFSTRSVARLASLGGWMTVSTAVTPLMLCADRVAIGSVISVAAVTYYASAYEIATKLWILQVAVTTVVFPAFCHAETLRAGQLDDMFRRSLAALILIVSLPALLLVGFADELLRLWLGADIAAHSAVLLRVLAFGCVFNCLANLASALLQSRGGSRAVALLQVSEIVAYLPLLILATSFYGLTGAAIAWSARALFDAIGQFVMVFRWSLLPCITPARVIWPALVTAFALAIAALQQSAGSSAAAVAVGGSLLLATMWQALMSDAERLRLVALLEAALRRVRRAR